MKTTQSREIVSVFHQDTHLETWTEAFLLDCKVRNLTPGTVRYYKKELRIFTDFCEAQVISQIDQVTPHILRQYLLYLEERGRNDFGVHAAFRPVRAFLYWYEAEAEPEGWKNPIKKVKAPKLPEEPLAPVETDRVQALINACPKNTLVGARDRAIFLALLDTGARAKEFLSATLDDLDLVLGTLLIRQGKGRKPRTVFLGRMSRKAVRAYLKRRKDSNPALWVGRGGERLHYEGLRGIVRRRADQAKVEEPTLHAFRRAFALTMLRKGTDIFTLAKLMGHKNIAVLQRYLRQTTEDTEAAHRKAGPVDTILA